MPARSLSFHKLEARTQIFHPILSMKITINADSRILRATIFLIALAGAGLFLLTAFSQFTVRTFADPRLTFTQEALRAAVAKYPSSPRMHLRLAEAELRGKESPAPAIAQTQAELAATLSPFDFQSWKLLALAQEANNEPAQAEISWQRAAALAPANSEVNWGWANLLLREGKIELARTPLRAVAKYNHELSTSLFEVLWRSKQDPTTLLAVAAQSSASQFALAGFLLKQGRAQDAVNVFRNIDRQTRVQSAQSKEFIDEMISARQFSLARLAWLDLRSAGVEGSDIVWNGSFEATPSLSESSKPFDRQFDWQIEETALAQPAIESGTAHIGTQSLRIAFTGRPTDQFGGEFKQTIVVRPGLRYRLECFVKTRELITSEGPQIAVFNQESLLALSPHVSAGSNDWQPLAVEFTVPNGVDAVKITLYHKPKSPDDEPFWGTLWFDDFTVTERTAQSQ